jgi:hypothetical protein
MLAVQWNEPEARGKKSHERPGIEPGDLRKSPRAKNIGRQAGIEPVAGGYALNVFEKSCYGTKSNIESLSDNRSQLRIKSTIAVRSIACHCFSMPSAKRLPVFIRGLVVGFHQLGFAW